MVAVKVIEQVVLPGKSQDLSREPLLSTSVSHPNVVTTYKLSIVCIKPDHREDSAQCSLCTSVDLSSQGGSCGEGKEPGGGSPAAVRASSGSGDGEKQGAGPRGGGDGSGDGGGGSSGGGELLDNGGRAAAADGEGAGGAAGSKAQRQPSLTPSVVSIGSTELASLSGVLPPG
jgi:hypothetical protein